MSDLARLAFPQLRWRRRTRFSHERRRIDETLKLGVGGYIVYGGASDDVRALTRDLGAASPHPLLIASDLERGAAQQFPDLTHLPQPAALGFNNQPDVTARCGAVTAAEARAVGVNWVYAPVADLDAEPDNPIVQTRSFGDDPATVARHVTAWVEAAEAGGVVASVKHYPGHGRTSVDSHEALPVIETSRDELLATDVAPFRAAVQSGVGSVMTAHVAYAGWDASGRPATLSPAVLGYLRQELRFDGVIVSDALIMEGVLRGRGERSAVVEAVAAGVDALLYPRDPAGVVRMLECALGATLPRARAEDALARVGWLTERAIGRAAAAAGSDHSAFADATADLAVHVLRGDQLTLREPLEVTVVDDDVGGPYAVGSRDVFASGLRAAGIGMAPGGTRIVALYSEPRSWKGRASLGPTSGAELTRLLPRTSLVVLFGHPRLVTQIGGQVPVICAWHGQPLMQRAAGRWVVGRLR